MDEQVEEPEREQRIINEIIVDCYGEHEQAMGWWCYLDSHLKFPFEAVLASHRAATTLTPSERMTVLSMADETECEHEMLVTADWDGMIEDVRLEEIWPRDPDAETLRAVSDWHYWVGRGNQL